MSNTEVPGLDKTARGRGTELALIFCFSSSITFLLMLFADPVDQKKSIQFNITQRKRRRGYRIKNKCEIKTEPLDTGAKGMADFDT